MVLSGLGEEEGPGAVEVETPGVGFAAVDLWIWEGEELALLFLRWLFI